MPCANLVAKMQCATGNILFFFLNFGLCTGFGNCLVPPCSTYEGDIGYGHPKLCSALSDVQ